MPVLLIVLSTTCAAEDQSAAALKLATDAFSRHWTHCNDTWVSRLESPKCYVQWKNVTPDFAPDQLTPADRLNGVTWRGQIRFPPMACREFYFDEKTSGGRPPGWSPWSDGCALWIYRATQTNGKWTLSEVDVSPKGQPVACEIVSSAGDVGAAIDASRLARSRADHVPEASLSNAPEASPANSSQSDENYRARRQAIIEKAETPHRVIAVVRSNASGQMTVRLQDCDFSLSSPDGRNSFVWFGDIKKAYAENATRLHLDLQNGEMQNLDFDSPADLNAMLNYFKQAWFDWKKENPELFRDSSSNGQSTSN